MSTKTKRSIGWVLAGLIAVLMLMSAFGKLVPNDELKAGLAGGKVTLETMRNIGIVELLCVILFLIPRTGIVGTLLLCGYLGGAIYAHLAMGDPGGVSTPILVSAAVWISSALRFPELSARLFGGSLTRAERA